VSFSDEELERYARHIVLREIGGAGQVRLSDARVLVIGAGGLGSPALMYLAAAGVGTLGIVDDDVVSLSNLQRQIVHDSDAVEKLKTDSAAASLKRINPHVMVVSHTTRLNEQNSAEILDGYDLVLDGSDNFTTRYTVNAACVKASIPLISGAISQWEGQISLFDPASGAPCYACIFPTEPASGQAPSCAEAGVMGALAGTIGAMMAGEAIKHITGAGQTLSGALFIFDALWGESRKIALTRRTDCAVCGGNSKA
jgi:molybdopterin/thiamine biosynthesis adenylyltransferase